MVARWLALIPYILLLGGCEPERGSPQQDAVSVGRPAPGGPARDFQARESALRAAPDCRPMSVPPTGGQAPAVVLITLDALRGEALYSNTSSGAPRMPALRAFSERSVVFTSGRTVAPETRLSLPALLTGQLPASARWEEVPEERSLPALLAQRGYVGTALVANRWILPSRGYQAGFRHFRMVDYFYPRPFRTGRRSPPRVDGQTLVREALERVQAHAAAQLQGDERSSEQGRMEPPRPLFLWLHLMDVHVPYEPLPPFLGQEDPSEGPVPTGNGVLPASASSAERRRLVARYWEAASTLDALLRPLLEKLAEPEVAAHTLTIVTADHGELLGERNLLGHGIGLYPELLQVPLIVRLPDGVRSARPEDAALQVTVPVSTLDVAPTVLDLLGVPMPPAVGACLQGESLLPLLQTPDCQAKMAARVLPALVTTLDTQETWLGASLEGWMATARSDPSGMSAPLMLRYPQLTEATPDATSRARLTEMLGCLQRAASVRELAPPVSKELRQRLSALGYVGGE